MEGDQSRSSNGGSSGYELQSLKKSAHLRASVHTDLSDVRAPRSLTTLSDLNFARLCCSTPRNGLHSKFKSIADVWQSQGTLSDGCLGCTAARHLSAALQMRNRVGAFVPLGRGERLTDCGFSDIANASQLKADDRKDDGL